MYLIDTHCHLYHQEFKNDEEEMLNRAAKVCSHVLLPNIDLSSIEGMLHLANIRPGFCLPMLGLHPCHVEANFEQVLDTLLNYYSPGKYIAVGETGLDLYWDKTSIDRQIESLKIQIQWALNWDLPLVLHTREANREALDLIQKYQNGKLRGVFHCFSGTLFEAQEMIELGFYLGIGGVVTYKKTDLPDILKQLPLDSIVLETDSPYLPPVPHRGKRNESAYIQLVAEKLVDVYQLSYDEIALRTSQNAKSLFRITN